MFTHKKVGGITFITVGSFGFSFYKKSTKAKKVADLNKTQRMYRRDHAIVAYRELYFRNPVAWFNTTEHDFVNQTGR